MSFGPKKITLQDIAFNSLGALIAGFIGSILIIIIVFMTSSFLSIPETFQQARLEWWRTNPMFPFILSFITFIATMVTLFLSITLLHMTSPEKYKNNTITYWQLWFFWIFTYLAITPIYIYTGLLDYDNIMNVFILHSILLIFGTSLLLEILNNYRYILTGFYGSFVGLFFTSIIVIAIFNSMETGYAKLISLLFMLPIINTAMTLFKGIFELLYYKYHLLSNTDYLWDIFHRIELEEQEILKEEEQKNNL